MIKSLVAPLAALPLAPLENAKFVAFLGDNITTGPTLSLLERGVSFVGELWGETPVGFPISFDGESEFEFGDFGE